jgi:hypothetical protein
MKGYYFLNKYYNDQGVRSITDQVPDDDPRWQKANIRGELVEDGKYEGTIDTNIRNVDLVRLGSMKSPSFSRDLDWVARQANALYFGYDIWSVVQIDMLRYQADDEGGNQFYDWHVDTDFWSKNHAERKLTIIIQLSDENDYEGGDLEFGTASIDEGHNFRAKGSIICFPAPWSHRITPVTKGVRKSIVAWAEGPPWR